MTDARKLLLRIARCPIARRIRKGKCAGSPCKKIVGVQDRDLPFHLPEPWSGDLVGADLLFIGSNPSIDCDEHYPNDTWTDAQLAAFFENRFTTWIKDDRTLKVFGNFGPSVPYLRTVRNLAEEILDTAEPGRNYAVTEAVHCKSKKQAGVGKAVKECRNYLNSILACSGARVLIVLGAVARNTMCRQYQQQLQDPKTNRLQKITIGNRLRLVLFLPHPNAHMKKEERQALEVAKGGFISEIQYLLTTSEFSA